MNTLLRTIRTGLAVLPDRAFAALLAALLLTIHTTAAGHGDVVKAANPPHNPAASHSARHSTTELIDLANHYHAAAPGQRGAALGHLLGAAKQRFDELVALAQFDPAEVLRVGIPAHVLAKLPPQAIPFLEREADETGELEVLHVDHVDSADDYYVHSLATANGKFPLYLAGDKTAFATGAKVRVRGLWLGSSIVADASELVVTKAAALPNTLGAQKTLVILVNFSNAPTQPYTVAQAQSIVFGTTSNYDYEASYQQTTLSGAVAGWFTIAEPNTTCNYTNIATQAKQKATAAGYVLSNYARYVYVFPSNACSWWGLGSVGGNPSQAWIHTKHGFTLAVVGHEMGHNLGLYHSHSMDCGTATIASSGCSTSDYGDVFDMMGKGSAHFNAFQKERLGWLGAGVSPPLTTVPAQAGTVTYAIAPFEDARNGVPRALKIPRGTACAANSEWFYVESRQAKGFDSFLSGNANVLGGVLIRKVTGANGDSSYLLDMTPATSTWSDAALVAGKSFTDPLSGVVIAPVSVGSTGALVNVTFPASSCVRAAPSVSVTPSGTVWTSAGASVSYAVAVTSRDSCGCAATTYDVSASVPAGWSATNARTASIVPGSTTSATMFVTTPPSAAPAFYTVSMTAANSSAASMVASAAGTVSITGALAVTATTDKSAYTKPSKGNGNITALITTSVRSGTSAVSGATVNVDVRDPGGKVTTLTGTTGSNGLVVVSYAMKARQALSGPYTVTSRATMGGTVGSASTAFTVN